MSFNNRFLGGSTVLGVCRMFGAEGTAGRDGLQGVDLKVKTQASFSSQRCSLTHRGVKSSKLQEAPSNTESFFSCMASIMRLLLKP